jgi:hypothetical protein
MIEDGVYFSLPESDYHALPALSASGIKNLLISPMDFWARSWMNPLKDIDEEDGDEPEWKIIGHAYHKRILEGKTAFDACYAPTFEAPKGCLKTIDDIETHLREIGADTKGCNSKPKWIARLKEVEPAALIYDELRAGYLKKHDGMEFLPIEAITKIELAAAMIEKHPHLVKCFRGGYPEVTVIWSENGVPFKSRFDYLKPKAVIDLKTFANLMNKPIDSAIYSAMASRKYHIQAAFYLRAVKAAQTLSHPVDFPGDDKWLEAFTDCTEHDFFFVFQQKGIAPLARGKKFIRGSLWACGEVAIDEAIARYKHGVETFGPDAPWIDNAPIEEFDDSMFPAYATEL